MFWKGLALWLGGFAVLALVGGGVLGLAFLGAEQSPAASDDLRISNHDEENHTVRIEAVPTNASDGLPVLEEAVTLEANESVRLDGATEAGEAYRLVVAIDDRDPESFEIRGPDDHCTTEVWVESNATADVVTACA